MDPVTMAAIMAGTGAASSFIGSQNQPGKLHGYQQRAQKGYINRANELADQPFQGYGGMPFADASPNLWNSYNHAGGMLDRGAWAGDTGYDLMNQGASRIGGPLENTFGISQLGGGDQLQQAGNTFQQGTGYAPDQFSAGQVTDTAQQFFNPYENEVIGNYTDDMDLARQRAQVNRGDQFSAMGALGGSANQLADATTNEMFGRQVGNQSAQMRQSGYNNSLANAFGLLEGNRQADITGQNMQQQAGQNLMGLGGMMGNRDLSRQGHNLNAAMGVAGSNRADANTLANIGSNIFNAGQQDFTTGYNTSQGFQPYLDRDPQFAYSEFLRGQEDPYRKLDVVGNAAGMSLGGGGGGGGVNPWLAALGGGLQGGANGYMMHQYYGGNGNGNGNGNDYSNPAYNTEFPVYGKQL